MARTLQQARDTVAAFLDELDADPSDPRWSTTEVDRALQYALNSCCRRYIQSGGDRLDNNQVLSTDTQGKISFSTDVPIDVRSVSLLQGDVVFPLNPTTQSQRYRNHKAIHQLEVKTVKDYVLPTTTTHPLVGDGATGANVFPAFEDWVCATAARYLAIKDGSPMPMLDALWAEVSETISNGPMVPKFRPFARAARSWSEYYSWTWDHNTKTLQLCSRF